MALPDLEAFPARTWGSLVARHGYHMQPWLRGFLPPAGYPPLRQAIARYLSTARGVRCIPEQVFITGGSQQGLALTGQVLLNPGDAVWMEDPGYRGAQAALQSAEARIVPVPVDAEGLSVAEGVRRAPNARLAYVTPSHQFPLGMAMSLRRRLDLLEWAHRTGGWILEDDYDSEFRYRGRPLTALQGLDEGQRVLYTGTFSKVLFPALRLGYLVVPQPLTQAFGAAAFTVGAPPPILEQLVLTDFLTEGHFERHLRRMRRLYAERQEAVLQAAAVHLNGMLELQPDEVGMHLVGWLPEGADDRAVSERAIAQEVRAQPLSNHRIEPGGRGGLLLGYAGFPIPALQAAIRTLAETLHNP
jgi:GntR family transcriptional regulator/MocR family aminotransferase